MANLHDYYFRQRVTEAELDEGFEFLEDADRSQNVDADLVGVLSGLDVAEDSGGASLNVEVATGTAYSKDGERIRVVGTQTVDVSVDEDSVSTEPALPGNSLVITIFASFERVLGDPRTDGNSATVYFDRFEGYELIVRRGAEAASPGVGTEETFINTNGVANDPSAIRLCDIIRANGQTTIANADIYTTRREDAFRFTAGALSVNAGTPEESDQALLQHIVNVVNGTTAVEYDPTNLPVPGTWSALAAAGTVQAAIDGIVDDLGQVTAVMGASLIGYDITATWQSAIAVTQSANTVAAAIEGVITDLADDTGTSGAARIGFDGLLSTGPDLVPLGSGVDVRDALFELDLTKGSLANDNDWAGTNNFNDAGTAATFASLARFDGNVRFNGASWIKEDPDHALASWELSMHEASLQDTGSATDTVDMLLYSDTGATAGVIEGVVMAYTDNTNDSFIGYKFVIPFTKLASSTPQLDNNTNFFTLFGSAGSEVTTLQGATPTSASISIEPDTNTISIRLTHNAGPTTRNLVAAWRTLAGPLNS